MIGIARAGCLGMVLVAIVAAGCGTVRVPGRVVAGVAGMPLVVRADDPRLQSPDGIANVQVDVLNEKGEETGSVTSGADGSFVLSFPSATAPTRAVTISARGGSIAPAEGTLYLPRDGSKVLIIAQPVAPAAGPGGAR